MNKLTLAAVVLATVGFSSSLASAATVTAGANDLILGFEIASGTGSNTNLEVDLGPISQFTSTASLTLSQLNVADIVATYGSGWADSNSGVSWGIAGDLSTNNNFVATMTGTPSLASASTLAGAYGQIANLSVGVNGQTSTANSTTATTIGTNAVPASTIPSSFTSIVGGNPGYAGFLADPEQVGAGSIDLFKFSPGVRTGGVFPNAPDLGTFSLSSNGVLTFTGSAAVPEPSAYALGICAAVLFLVLRRRASVV